jgi:hypothetical protein
MLATVRVGEPPDEAKDPVHTAVSHVLEGSTTRDPARCPGIQVYLMMAMRRGLSNERRRPVDVEAACPELEPEVPSAGREVACDGASWRRPDRRAPPGRRHLRLELPPHPARTPLGSPGERLNG